MSARVVQAAFPPLVTGFSVNLCNILVCDWFPWHVNKINSLSIPRRRAVQFVCIIFWLSADFKDTLHQVVLWFFSQNRRCERDIKIASSHTLWLGNPHVRLTWISRCRKVAFFVLSNCLKRIRKHLIKPISPWRRLHIYLYFFQILSSGANFWVRKFAFIHTRLF